MTDTTTVQSGDSANGAAPQVGADGKPIVTTDKTVVTATDFDPAKISDADFEKIFGDKRLFGHSRFKELNDLAQEGKRLKLEQDKAKEEELRKKGEFETLAQNKEKEVLTLKEQIKTSSINNSLIIAATKLGVVDADAALKLVDRGAISMADDGTVTGAEDALKKLIEAKPYLAGKPGTTRLGSPSAPGDQNTGDLKRFKHSQMKDPVFFRENEKDILASMKAGLIEMD